jgi:hypothetical protein
MISIGIIAEDDSDVECLKVIIARLVNGNTDYICKGRGTRGGGNMFNKRKMRMRILSLQQEGCAYLIVVHDLDRDGQGALNDEEALHGRLDTVLTDAPIAHKCVVIPIEEIEAWLLSDKYDKPQELVDPKKILQTITNIQLTSNNAAIAQQIDLALVENRCPSFRPLARFVRTIFIGDIEKHER